MALQQVSRSVENDGNFSEIDLQDLALGGPLYRIEMFRASHPDEGPFCVTAAGTLAGTMIGRDHLRVDSNRVFRNNFSLSDAGGQAIKIEIRETFAEDGSLDARMRDLDESSETYGSAIIATAKPVDDHRYHVTYNVMIPTRPVVRSRIPSPLPTTIEELTGLPDLSEPSSILGTLDLALGGNALDTTFSWLAAKADINQVFEQLESSLQADAKYATFLSNIVAVERMGHFRDKTIHPGLNLLGNQTVASEAILARKYRSSLILFGRVADPAMTWEVRNDQSLLEMPEPCAVEAKQGVYSAFLNAHLLNSSFYRLGLDKVHSDYGGIPMKLRPGSRLENGSLPLVDASRFNRTLAELAVAYYVRVDFPAMRALATAGVL